MEFRSGPVESVVVNREFWRGKRVLLTGHTGFKGSWLSLWLHALGAEVVGYALPPTTEPNLYAVARVEEGLTSVLGDVRDFNELYNVLVAHRPEIVIHMAAQALVRYSYDHPVETYETNVMGTVNVLEAIRQVPGVRAVLCVTSDKCYENLETKRPYVESDRMGGHDPYSSSKGCSELVASTYRRCFFAPEVTGSQGVALATARAGNVIGGGDWSADRLIADIMAAYLNNEPPLVRNPQAVRPWQYVLDPLSGYLSLVERLWEVGDSYTGAWNFGPDLADCKPVEWVVERIHEIWGAGPGWRQAERAGAHEAGLLFLNTDKARSKLGWSGKLTLAQALEWTVEWYRGYGRGDDMAELTREQITRHDGLVVV